MIRATPDTNVIISALNFPGNPSRILQMGKEGVIQLAVSGAILDEAARVLQRPKFGWPKEQVDQAVDEILRFAEYVQPDRKLDVVKDDPTDNRILECAVASRSEYLVSGDKHLLSVGRYEGVTVITPADFLQEVGKSIRGR